MKIFFSCIAFVLIAPFISIAQTNYKPGYVVNFKNDTLKGYIDYKEWKSNPEDFNFKKSPDDQAVVKFSVANAQAFGVTGFEYYQKATVNISTGNVEVGGLHREIDSSYRTGTVFLKIITSGANLSLFYFTDKIKTRYYVEDKSDLTFAELGYFVFLDREDNRSIQTVNAFRSQLTVFAVQYKPNNDNLIRQIQNSGYNEIELRNIVKLINGGEGAGYAHEKLSGTRFFLGAGVKGNNLSFKTINNTPFPNGTNQSSTFPVVSGGVDLILNKNTQKVIFRLEASVTQNKYSFLYSTPTDLQRSASLDFKQFNVVLAPQVIYNFYSGANLKAYLGAGVGVNYSGYNSYAYTINYFDGTTSTAAGYPQFDKIWLSFPIRAGVQIGHNVEVYAIYWIPQPIVTAGDYSAHITSYQAGINFLFGK